MKENTHPTNAELFAAFISEAMGLQRSEPAPPAEPEPKPTYPNLPDPGEPLRDFDAYCGTPQQQFVDWMNRTGQLDYDPFVDKDGWKRII